MEQFQTIYLPSVALQATTVDKYGYSWKLHIKTGFFRQLVDGLWCSVEEESEEFMFYRGRVRVVWEIQGESPDDLSITICIALYPEQLRFQVL